MYKSYSTNVQKGLHKASALGFPTLNIFLDDTSLSGIFAGIVEFNHQKFHAALYADQKRNLLEAHLINFEDKFKNIDVITITPLRKIREAVTFTSLEEAKKTIENDIEEIKDFFDKNQND